MNECMQGPREKEEGGMEGGREEEGDRKGGRKERASNPDSKLENE